MYSVVNVKMQEQTLLRKPNPETPPMRKCYEVTSATLWDKVGCRIISPADVMVVVSFSPPQSPTLFVTVQQHRLLLIHSQMVSDKALSLHNNSGHTTMLPAHYCIQNARSREDQYLNLDKVDMLAFSLL